MVELGILLLLLCLGYGFGSYREKKHFESIFQREAKFQDILVFESRPPKDDNQGIGANLVMGNVVISSDYFKTFVAGLRKLIGGRLRSYETLLDRGRREALLRMKRQARELGATHIFNVRFETASVSQGADKRLSSIEVLAYGSAVRR